MRAQQFWQSVFIILFSVILGIFLIWVFDSIRTSYQVYEKASEDELRDFFYQQKISQSELQNKFKEGEKIKILIVPGHTDEFPGTTYKDVREFDLNNLVANSLLNLIEEDEKFEVKIFKEGYEVFDYVSQIEDIDKFKKSYQRLERFFNEGDKDFVLDTNLHSHTEEEVINTLYGINFWLNENDYDIAIHIHFNNYNRFDNNKPGEIEGFSIYVPYHKYSNGIASQKLAHNISNSLDNVLEKSNLSVGDSGIIEDNSLIALGSFNSLNSISVLIEYGFIYEDKFINGDKEIFYNVAKKTYEGVLEFLK